MPPFKRLLPLAAALIVLIGFAVIWFSGKKVSLKISKPITAVGNNSSITAETDDPHGVKSFAAYLEQNGQRQVVFEDKTKSKQASRTYTFNAGRQQAPFLKEGPARLTLEASSNDFRGAKTTLTQDVQVILRPPTIVADGRQHYLNLGGSELVTFDLSGAWTDSGVHAAKYTSESFPMPGEPDNSNHRFSLFAYPWDLPADTIPLAFVRNSAGTEVTATFWTRIFPKQWRSSDIPLTDQNLQKVVGELDPEGSGPLVDRFVKINREMRKANNQQIYDLRLKTENRILWSGPFVPMIGKRESYFADRRSYFYNGKKVDEQVHLGFDLAQSTNMSVKSANSGKIVWADRLGIYGNCVVIDHGYALQTLYGHMSKIDVKVGDSVAKGQHIGVSGSTGMAFGDHVHFSMLVAGYQINPIEWWDEHWIHDRILSKIGPNPSKQDTASPAPAEPKAKKHKKHR